MTPSRNPMKQPITLEDALFIAIIVTACSGQALATVVCFALYTGLMIHGRSLEKKALQEELDAATPAEPSPVTLAKTSLAPNDSPAP
jgi:hypothetical protein